MRKSKVTVEEITFPDLDKQLQNLAVLDFEKFCKLTAIDKVQVFICMEHQKGKSLQQIANRTKLSKTSVHNRCKKCDDQNP